MALAAVEDALTGGWEDQLGGCCGPDEGLWNLTQEQQGRRRAGFEGERGAELTELGDCEGRDEERKELRVRCQGR